MMVEKVYSKLPKSIQYAAKYAYGTIPISIRYGKVFRDTYAFLRESQWWSKEQLEEYQLEQLSKLLKHAYENVPYYRRVFDERGLKPKDVQDFKDLQLLPYLTKEDVRANFNDLIARNIPKEQMDYGTTGGSTAIPLGLYIEKKAHNIRDAFDWRQYNWANYYFGDKCVVLRGNVINMFENGKRAWWEYDPFNNCLILSSYDMTEENLFKYVEKIEEFQTKVIRGYPSALDILARFIKEQSMKINKKGNIKAISTSSETLYQPQRELIEDVFGCKIFDLYGNYEQVPRFGECEMHEGLHIYLEYGITEIIGKDGKPVTKEGEIGEIVGTGFTNYAFPLIRYKPEDLSVWTNKRCSCGRELPLIKRIEGRLQELVVTKKGNLIPMTGINMHSDVFDNVKQFQFVQEKKGRLIMNIIKKSSYTDKDTEYILSELYKKMGDGVDIEIVFVDEIPLTERGKYRFLIQKLPIGFGDKQDEQF
jgi:phenylacetate-CoA ligase